MANYYEQCSCGAYCQEAPCYDCLKRQLGEAVGALELFKFPGVIGSDLPDDYTFTVEIKAVNFKRVEQLLQSPAAKAAGERVRAMEAVVEAAREDSEGVKGQ